MRCPEPSPTSGGRATPSGDLAVRQVLNPGGSIRRILLNAGKHENEESGHVQLLSPPVILDVILFLFYNVTQRRPGFCFAPCFCLQEGETFGKMRGATPCLQ